MTSWVMAVEVTPSELVAVDIDRADRAGTGSLRPRRVLLGTDDTDPEREAPDPGAADPVDLLADAFARALAGADSPEAAGPVPTRVVIATPPDTERRRFEEIAEATALVGLPAPAWLPGPVALVGDRIAAEVEPGGQSVVLDARGGGLTAWPVRRTAAGAEIGSRGPIATGTRLDQLLLGVVRAQLHSLDPDRAGSSDDDPRPGSRTPGAARDLRGEAARLRRSIRRARGRLAGEEVDEARVAAEDLEVVVDRAVFDQLVEHAVRETLAEVADGPEGPRGPVVHVLADRATPLARRLVEITAGREPADEALVLPGSLHDGVLGLAALLSTGPSRAARAASGAQAIRAARAVGSPPTPVGVGGGPGPSGPEHLRGLHDGGDPDDGGVPDDDGRVADDDYHLPTPATGFPRPDEGADDPGAVIPEARMPSSPVQAQQRLATAPGRGADDEEAAEPVDSASSPVHTGAGSPDTGHQALAAAVPHEVRPASDAPPGGGSPAVPERGWSGGVPEDSDGADRPLPHPAVRQRRGPDTAPQPAAELAGRAPRGVVPVLVVLVVLAVLAAVGVLLVGPDQVDAAFAGLGAGAVDLTSLTR